MEGIDLALPYYGWTLSDGFRRGVVFAWGQAHDGEVFLILDTTGQPPEYSYGALKDEISRYWSIQINYIKPGDDYSERYESGAARVTTVFLTQIKEKIPPKSNKVFPHTCNCGAPAQQLFNMVDCSSPSCRHFRMPT